MRTWYRRGVAIMPRRMGAEFPAGDSPAMPLLSTPLLARACRIYLDTAYPGGAPTIPEHKRAYAAISPDEPVQRYLMPSPLAQGICQKAGEGCYTFRLGSPRYVNLKMKVHCVAERGACQCVFSVDTHDAFSKDHVQCPADHPDAAAWLELQAANRELKEKIEAAWGAAGILTHNGLLRAELVEAAQ
jgi:hypothetical protein